MKRIELYRNVNSCTISIEDGPTIGQKIKHFHAHIVPRAKGDFDNNDDIYKKFYEFDDLFIKSYPELLTNDKKKIILKSEIDNIKNFMNKLYIY